MDIFMSLSFIISLKKNSSCPITKCVVSCHRKTLHLSFCVRKTGVVILYPAFRISEGKPVLPEPFVQLLFYHIFRITFVYLSEIKSPRF